MAIDWSSSETTKRYKAAEDTTGPFGRFVIEQCGLDRADCTEDLVILDSACGTGIVTHHLYDVVPPVARPRLQVICGDFSAAMIESMQARIDQNGWTYATAKILDAQKLDLPNDQFTHVIMSFAIVGLPNPYAAFSEIYRVLRPGGTCGLTTWKLLGWFTYAEAALTRVPNAPRLAPFPEFSRTFLKVERAEPVRWTEPEYFEARVSDAGFENVRTELRSCETRYASAEEYVRVFGVFTLGVMGHAWTAQERARVAPHYEGALLAALKEEFGDGEVVVRWEAYCITAQVPAVKA